VGKTISPFFLCILLLTVSIRQTWAQYPLVLTIETDKEYYYLDETVYIYGNLTLEDVQVSDGLIGLEIENPKNKSIIIRTLPTGDISNKTWLIEILSVIPCDEWGVPKNSFQIGTLSYFNITLKNNDIENRHVYISVNIFDSSQTPIGLSAFEAILYANSTGQVILSVPIPETASLGTAEAYANVFSLRPKQAGKPYGPEKSAQFNITNSQTGSTLQAQLYTSSINGNFNLSFHISPYGIAGEYTISASSIYEGYVVFKQTTFYVKVPGDVNGDFRVDLIDASLLGLAWWSTPSDPNWNPECDFNKDNRVDVADASLIGRYWGYKI